MTKLPDKIRVKVTREHIEQGRPRTFYSCPIALALKDMGYRSAGVGTREFWVRGKKYLMPDKAFDFVYCFDKTFNEKHREVLGIRPITFTAKRDVPAPRATPRKTAAKSRQVAR